MRFWLAIAAVLSSFVSASVAGEYNPTLSIGDAAPAWEKLPGVDDKEYSLADLADKELVVVAFTCNSCPVAADYEDRILALAKKYEADERVAVVAINPNTIPEDRLPKMKERAEQKRFTFPYLHDAKQATAKAYGATFTPEFFLLDRHRKIAYMGAMDDSSNASTVKSNYLEPAIEALLAGKSPETTETVAIGCRVRYERRRR